MLDFYCQLIEKINSSYFNVNNDINNTSRFVSKQTDPFWDKMDTLAEKDLTHKNMVNIVQNGLNSKINPFRIQYEYLYDLMADEASKKLLIDLCALRVMGERKIRILDNPLSNDWIDRINSCVCEEGEYGKIYDLSRLDSYSRDLKVILDVDGIFVNYITQQYAYHGSIDIDVEPGDYVIDGGAYFGETALDFAEKAGKTGKVFAFEFVDENINVMDKAFSYNPELSDRIVIAKHPLWIDSATEINYEGAGSGARLTDKGSGNKKAVTVSIDDYVRNENIDKIDFIKMDIEGAELQALQGAEKTIREFRPKLAICVYHNLYHDLITIPPWLNNLKCGYKFYLKHSTSIAMETVLFAMPV